MPSTVFRPADKPLLNLTLFVLTLGTTFGTFLLMWSGGGATTPSAVNGSLIFSLSLVLILGSHEMGHYVLARIHKVDTSLPYFIPLPLLGVGTLGAVIRIRGRIPDRNALVDIGAAGPLAGLLVAIPLLAFGLSHSKIVDLPVEPPGFLGESSLWSLAHRGVEYGAGFAFRRSAEDGRRSTSSVTICSSARCGIWSSDRYPPAKTSRSIRW